MHSPQTAARLRPATGNTPLYLEGPRGRKLAYLYAPGDNKAAGPAPRPTPRPTIVFMPGYKSDMMGSKATFLAEKCAENGLSCLRFDYTAHGASGGVFADCTLSDWLDDAEFMVRGLGGPCILVGSSMGGWLGLRLCERHPDAVAAFVGIAAAPDFTRDIKAAMTPAHKAQMDAQGYITEDNAYSPDPYIFTRALLEDGERHCMLDRAIAYPGPVHLLQGMADADVHWSKALQIRRRLGPDCAVTLVEDATHTLSRPQDLDLLWQTLCPFIGLPAPAQPDILDVRIRLRP